MSRICIDGHYGVRFKRQPQGEKWVAPTFCPGCFVPWPEHRVYDRTVHCPAGGGNRFNMPVCNAHNDFHVWIPVPANLPKTKDGWFHFRAHHRLLSSFTKYSDHRERTIRNRAVSLISLAARPPVQ